MALETDADLAAMFDLTEWAEAAVCTPAGGAATACAVIADETIETNGIGIAGISGANRKIQVRAAEITDPRGATFTGIASLGAGQSFVVADASLDVLGAVWSCLLRPTA